MTTRRGAGRRTLSLLLSLTTTATLVAGCGDSGEDAGGTAGEDGLTPVTVGVLPIADMAPLHHGIEQGYFEEEGLEVTTEVGQGGAALVPAVASGDYQLAFGNYVSLMLARQNGVEVRIVTNVVDGAERPDRGTNGLLVTPDSGIESVDDLAGRTFVVTTLENVAEVTIRTTLESHGVDHSDVAFTEAPFPNMNVQVQSGEVDVAWQAEPFVTLGTDAGLVNLVDPMHGTMPSMPLAGMFASEQWLEEEPETAAAFDRAMQRSLEAADDEEAMRDAIAASTETPPDVVAALALANWQPGLDEERLADVGELAASYGILDSAPDMDELVWRPE